MTYGSELRRLRKIRQTLAPEYPGDPSNTHVISTIRKQFNAAALDAEFSKEMHGLHIRPGQLWTLNRAAGKKGFEGKYDPDRYPFIELNYIEDFMKAARRVVNDDKALAAAMPGTFEQKDAELLEKHKLPSLAALVQAKLQK